MTQTHSKSAKAGRAPKSASLFSQTITLPDVTVSARQIKQFLATGKTGASDMKARPGDKVVLHFSGRRVDGSLFDTTRSSGPIKVVIGEGTYIAAFERALVGMRPGTRRRVTILAEHAYGPYQEELVYTISREDVPSNTTLHVGACLGGEDGNGRDVTVRVSALDAETVTLDANHPLAGEDLVFDIHLLKIFRR